jgi:small-conductance mechanosensitive channel/CRP-like cAMP-binding protein
MSWPFAVEPLHRFLVDIGIEGPVAAGAVLGLDLMLAGILHKELRRGLRFSAALAWLYLTISAARCFMVADTELDRIFRVLAALSIALCVAQTGFIVVVDFILGRNNRRPLRPLIRYGVLGITFLSSALVGLKAGGVETIGVLGAGAVVIGGVGAAVAEVLRQVGAGVLVQYARPFEQGDVIQVTTLARRGAVMSINWRTTTIRGGDGVDVMVPNNDLVASAMMNFGKGDRIFRRDIEFQLVYGVAPDRVRDAAIPALRDVPGLEPNPPPELLLLRFEDSGVVYQLQYWTKRAADWERVDAEARARVWYAFARASIDFSTPTRVLQLVDGKGDDPATARARRADQLARSQLFAKLPADSVHDIATNGREHAYGSGEVIVLAGEVGTTMYVVLDGEVAVQAPFDRRELLRLKPGDFFGEMSLVTGSPRAATVVTTMPTRTFVIDQPDFRQMLEKHPEVADTLSDILATRQSDLTSALEQKPADSQRSRHLKSLIMDRLKGIFRLDTPSPG